MKKIKIAILSDNFLPGTGGTENAVLHLSTALTKLGHEVMVCAPEYWAYEDNFDFEVNRCSAKVSRGDANYYHAKPSRSKEFIEKLESFKPDILHCHTDDAMLNFAIKYSKKHKIPLVTTIHTKFSHCIYRDTHSKLITAIVCKFVGARLKKCDAVCAVSKDMRKEFDLYGYKKDFHVVKNGASFQLPTINDEMKQLAKQKFDINTENVLIFVGHVVEFKNINFIFEALEKLYEIRKDFLMVFAGAIQDEKFVKKVENSCLKNNVIFTGNITDKSVLHSLYANAKILLFPSIFDNDSLVIVESAVHKVPAIVVKDTGSSERITNERNGFIIENEPEEMSNKINFLLDNKDILKVVGENAAKELPKEWSKAAEEYLEIYEKTIKNFNK